MGSWWSKADEPAGITEVQDGESLSYTQLRNLLAAGVAVVFRAANPDRVPQWTRQTFREFYDAIERGEGGTLDDAFCSFGPRSCDSSDAVCPNSIVGDGATLEEFVDVNNAISDHFYVGFTMNAGDGAKRVFEEAGQFFPESVRQFQVLHTPWVFWGRARREPVKGAAWHVDKLQVDASFHLQVLY